MTIRASAFWYVFAAFILPTASHLLTVYALSLFLLEHYPDRPAYVSTTELMGTLPVLAGFLVIGLAVDRFHRKYLALLSLILRIFLVCGLIFAISQQWFVALFALLFVRMFFFKLFATMEMSILQGLLAAHEYMKASVLKQFATGVLALTGSFVALYIYRSYGIHGVFVIDGIFSLIAVFLLAKADVPESASLPNGREGDGRPLLSVLADVKAGLVYVWNSLTLRSILLAFMTFGLLNAMLAVLPIFSIRFELTADVATYQNYATWMSFMLGTSFVLGSLTSTWWHKRLRLFILIPGGLGVIALLLTLLGVVRMPVLFFAIIFVIGFVIVMINVMVGGTLPRIVTPAYMGRTYALLDPASLATKSVALMAIGYLFPNVFSLLTLYIVSGCLLLLNMFIVAILLRKQPL